MNPQISPALQAAIARRQGGGVPGPDMSGSMQPPTPPGLPAGQPVGMPDQGMPPGAGQVLGGQPAAAMQSQGLDDQTKNIIRSALTALMKLM